MERKNKKIVAGMMAGFCVLSTQTLVQYGLLVGNSSSLQAFGISNKNALEDQHQEELDASREEKEEIVKAEKKLDDLTIEDKDEDVEILDDTNSCNGCHYELVDGEAILTIFSDRGMTELTIPKYVQKGDIRYKVTKMYTGRFVQLGALEIINIPSTMTDICSCDFYTNEDNGYWFNNENLKAINVDPDNHFYESVNGVLFLKNDKTLIKYPANKEGDTYKIPEGTKIIGDGAFYGSIHLISITMSGSEKIVGNYAFAQCSNLESINIPKGAQCRKDLEAQGLGDKIVELDDIVDIHR